MIITFSGQDGAGKSTALLRLSDDLKKNNIDHRIIYARIGTTPRARKYRARLGENADEKRIGRFLWLSTLELIYLWCIKLRWQARGKRVVLCDRYVCDTEIDLILRKKSFLQNKLWSFLVKHAPTPSLSVLFSVSGENAKKRLNLKEEYPTDESIFAYTEQYGKIKENFDFVIDADSDKESVYTSLKKTTKAEIDMHRDKKRLSGIKKALIRKGLTGENSTVVFEKTETCGSLATGYRVLIDGEVKYFAKLLFLLLLHLALNLIDYLQNNYPKAHL